MLWPSLCRCCCLAASQRRAPRLSLKTKCVLNLPRLAAVTARPWRLGARRQRWRRQRCPLQAGAATSRLQAAAAGWAEQKGEQGAQLAASQMARSSGVQPLQHSSDGGQKQWQTATGQASEGRAVSSCTHRTALPVPPGRRAAPAPQSAEGSSGGRGCKAESEGRH